MRLTVRRMMAVVAIAGLLSATAVMVRRSNESRAAAARQATAAQLSIAYADDACGRKGDKQRVARGEQMAAYHTELRLKYERAARFPWLAVDPEPPVPIPPD